MKKIILIILVFVNSVFVKSQDQNNCDFISNYLKEMPLECMDKNKLKESTEIYQFIKWNFFKDDYLLVIEKTKGKIIFIKKKYLQKSMNLKTHEEIPRKLVILNHKRISNKKYIEFKAILNQFQFWNKENYITSTDCTDGSGILIYALKKEKFIQFDNGNCNGEDELYKLYIKIDNLFN